MPEKAFWYISGEQQEGHISQTALTVVLYKQILNVILQNYVVIH